MFQLFLLRKSFWKQNAPIDVLYLAYINILNSPQCLFLGHSSTDEPSPSEPSLLVFDGTVEGCT